MLCHNGGPKTLKNRPFSHGVMKELLAAYLIGGKWITVMPKPA
jgi:hypothetical protein